MRTEHILPGALVSSREMPNTSWRCKPSMLPPPIDPLCIIVQRNVGSYMLRGSALVLVGNAESLCATTLTWEQLHRQLILERGAPGNIPKKGLHGAQ